MSCYSFLRGMMIFFNVIVFLGGGLLLGAGVWIKVDGSSFTKILGADLAVHFVNVGYFCIAAGGLLILLGLLGCVAAWKESKCLLVTFFVIVLIIFIAEVAAAIVALIYGSLVSSLLETQAMKSLQTDYGHTGAQQVITDAWNAVMQEFKCCGFNGSADFTGSYFQQMHGSSAFPAACCGGGGNATVSPATTVSPSSNSTCSVPTYSGCYGQLKDLFQKNAYIIGGIAAGTCGLELAAMLVALILACQVDKHGKDG